MVHNKTCVKQITGETQQVNDQAENEDESIAEAQALFDGFVSVGLSVCEFFVAFDCRLIQC